MVSFGICEGFILGPVVTDFVDIYFRYDGFAGKLEALALCQDLTAFADEAVSPKYDVF